MDKGKIYEILIEDPNYFSHLVSFALITDQSVTELVDNVIAGVYTTGNEDAVCEIIDIAFCQKITENIN